MSNVSASVRARLLDIAKAQGVDFNQVLVRFALERILFRLSQSGHADQQAKLEGYLADLSILQPCAAAPSLAAT